MQFRSVPGDTRNRMNNTFSGGERTKIINGQEQGRDGRGVRWNCGVAAAAAAQNFRSEQKFVET